MSSQLPESEIVKLAAEAAGTENDFDALRLVIVRGLVRHEEARIGAQVLAMREALLAWQSTTFGVGPLAHGRARLLAAKALEAQPLRNVAEGSR